MKALSEAARSALVSCGTSRIGATPNSTTAPEVLEELRAAGLIGTRKGAGVLNGLTRRGNIERDRIMDEKLMEAFG